MACYLGSFLACGAAGPGIAYGVDIVRLRISAQKLVKGLKGLRAG